MSSPKPFNWNSTLQTSSRQQGDEMLRAISAQAASDALDLDVRQLETIDLLIGSALGHLDPVHGSPDKNNVYLWGPPGRGKTWLVGAFFEALPTQSKLRVHFHDFFRDLHAMAHKATFDAMKDIEISDTVGEKRGNPDRVAARTSAIERSIHSILGNVEVLCFDEFHCNDPGDAMLLARTVKYIVDRGILLITTSNYPPEELLADEYYHHLVMPTIAMIRGEMTVHELDAQRDYRTLNRAEDDRVGFSRGNVLYSWDVEVLATRGLVQPESNEATFLTPTSHQIRALRIVDRQIWFDFSDLCEALTSTLDYLKLAQDYDHWIISDVPSAERMTPFGLRRMANTIDVLYDQQIRLDLITAENFTDSFAQLPELEAARLHSRINALNPAHDHAPAAITTREGSVV